MAIINLYEHTRYRKLKDNRKRLWKDEKEAISVQRRGPDVNGGQMQYFLKWRGGWGMVQPHEIRPMMKILNAIHQDACERVHWPEKEEK
jgi:hypothetical protein